MAIQMAKTYPALSATQGIIPICSQAVSPLLADACPALDSAVA